MKLKPGMKVKITENFEESIWDNGGPVRLVGTIQVVQEILDFGVTVHVEENIYFVPFVFLKLASVRKIVEDIPF